MVKLREKWPILGRHEQAAAWLQVCQDLGRAPRTIDAYARGLAEYLELCERESVDPVRATRAHIALHVRELGSRPSRRGANVVALDSRAGLSNATLQQRLVSVRLFYDFLVEEGLRQDNPVGRGRYTPGARGGGRQRGLVRRLVKLPWIPSDEQWRAVLTGSRRRAGAHPAHAGPGLRCGPAPGGVVLATRNVGSPRRFPTRRPQPALLVPASP
ncbi:site-specific integrase [Streptomyces mirabilis]